MKKHWKTIILTIIGILILGLAGICFYVPISFGQRQYMEPPEALAIDMQLPKEEVQADRNQMIEYIEHIHPYFLVEENRDAYQSAKDTYISLTEDAMTVGEFQIATGEYLCFFGDGHTGMKWNEEQWLYVPWQYKDNKLFLKNDGKTSEIWVTSVGGIETDIILSAIEKIFPAENEMAQQINYEKYADGKNLLNFLGADIHNNMAVVHFSDDSEAEYAFVEPVRSDDIITNSWYWKDDIFVVDFNTCENDAALQQIAEELEDAVAQGCNKVIIDVRGNGGGDSNACERLLEALGMKAPQYDMFVRYSKESAKQNGYIRKSGSVNCKGVSKSKINDRVKLVVLSDRYTFSSATMLLVFVRDGKLGTIIGEPSSNMPNSFGDIIFFSLENSHIWGTISHKQFVRPDKNNKERMLVPDVLTTSGEALEKAVQYLNEK